MTTATFNPRNNVTVWETPESQVDSQYGRVAFRKWCEKEITRMAANGCNVVIVEQKGMIALNRSTDETIHP